MHQEGMGFMHTNNKLNISLSSSVVILNGFNPTVSCCMDFLISWWDENESTANVSVCACGKRSELMYREVGWKLVDRPAALVWFVYSNRCVLFHQRCSLACYLLSYFFMISNCSSGVINKNVKLSIWNFIVRRRTLWISVKPDLEAANIKPQLEDSSERTLHHALHNFLPHYF